MRWVERMTMLCLFLCCRWSAIGQKYYINSIGMEFIRVPAGEMVVGRFRPTVSRMTAWGSELPLNEMVYNQAVELARSETREGFRVSIPAPYYIGKYEVTQKEWLKLMARNPSYFKKNKVLDDQGRHPVEGVCWRAAQRFINKLNKAEKGIAMYRLPTEFEWEFAARAGTEDDISWREITESAVIASQSTAVSGSKKPNAWGIYDMLGNVWEWVRDYYNEKPFADPLPPSAGKEHVLKGASFFGDVKNATYMTHAAGPGSGYDVGFRLVMQKMPDGW